MRLEGLTAFKKSGAPEGVLAVGCVFLPLDLVEIT
jgi:hypothetical protein